MVDTLGLVLQLGRDVIAEIKKSNEICFGMVISNKNSEQFGLKDLETKKNMFDQLVDYLLRK